MVITCSRSSNSIPNFQFVTAEVYRKRSPDSNRLGLNVTKMPLRKVSSRHAWTARRAINVRVQSRNARDKSCRSARVQTNFTEHRKLKSAYTLLTPLQTALTKLQQLRK